jgi:hypothetical protein
MKFQITITDNLHSFNDYVEVVQTKDSGEKLVYQMTLLDLIHSLSSSSAEYIKEESPNLPANCRKFVKKNNGKEYDVYIEIPKQQWNVELNGNPFKVGFPRLIFKWNLSKTSAGKWKVSLSKIVAVKGTRRISADTPVYQFPYSNVDSNGNVCMGGNQWPEISDMAELETLHSVFFHSPFSNDWGAKTKLNKRLEELFGDIFNEKDFDDEVLVPYGRSFSQFFGLNNNESE